MRRREEMRNPEVVGGESRLKGRLREQGPEEGEVGEEGCEVGRGKEGGDRMVESWSREERRETAYLYLSAQSAPSVSGSHHWIIFPLSVQHISHSFRNQSQHLPPSLWRC